jgi:hypothetical protein
VEDRGDQEIDVAVVVTGDGVAELDRDVSGEAGSESEHSLFPAGAGEFAGVEGGDHCFQSMLASSVPGSVMLSATWTKHRKSSRAGPRAVGEDHPGAGFERVEAVGSGAERCLELRVGHASPSADGG